MPEDYQTILDDLGVDTSSGNTDGQQTGGQEQNPVNPQAGDNAGANATGTVKYSYEEKVYNQKTGKNEDKTVNTSVTLNADAVTKAVGDMIKTMGNNMNIAISEGVVKAIGKVKNHPVGHLLGFDAGGDKGK